MGPRSLHQEMECDDDDMMQVMSDMQGGANGQNPIVMEAKAVYKQLRTLCGTLKNSHDDDSGGYLRESLLMDNYLLIIQLSFRPALGPVFGLNGQHDRLATLFGDGRERSREL